MVRLRDLAACGLRPGSPPGSGGRSRGRDRGGGRSRRRATVGGRRGEGRRGGTGGRRWPGTRAAPRGLSKWVDSSCSQASAAMKPARARRSRVSAGVANRQGSRSCPSGRRAPTRWRCCRYPALGHQPTAGTEDSGQVGEEGVVVEDPVEGGGGHHDVDRRVDGQGPGQVGLHVLTRSPNRARRDRASTSIDGAASRATTEVPGNRSRNCSVTRRCHAGVEHPLVARQIEPVEDDPPTSPAGGRCGRRSPSRPGRSPGEQPLEVEGEAGKEGCDEELAGHDREGRVEALVGRRPPVDGDLAGRGSTSHSSAAPTCQSGGAWDRSRSARWRATGPRQPGRGRSRGGRRRRRAVLPGSTTRRGRRRRGRRR